MADDTRTFVGVVGGFLSTRVLRALAPLAAPASKNATARTANGTLVRAVSIRAADTARALSAGHLFLSDPRKGERLSRAACRQLRLRITLNPPFTGRRGRVLNEHCAKRAILAGRDDEHRLTVAVQARTARNQREIPRGLRILKRMRTLGKRPHIRRSSGAPRASPERSPAPCVAHRLEARRTSGRRLLRACGGGPRSANDSESGSPASSFRCGR